MTTTRAEEDYLRAIHDLGGVGVHPRDVATSLRVHLVTARSMCERLNRKRLTSGKNRIQLTSKGIREARRILRRHRLAETFLCRVLGMDWSEVDAEADQLEHAISARVEEAMASYLGHPREDPHGHLIPLPDGVIPPRRLQAVETCPEGVPVRIREAADNDPARLRRWQELGLVPGVVLTIVRREPLDGTLEVCVGERVFSIGTKAYPACSANWCRNCPDRSN